MLKLIMAYLIISGNLKQQQKKINQLTKNKTTELKKNNPDFLEISPGQTIGIDQIRQIKSFLNKKSWQGEKIKTVIVNQADKMTIQAQNAFLKTLEEHGQKSLIILTAANKHALLPTIISRCQIIRLKFQSNKKNKNLEKTWQKWQKLINSDLDKQLKDASKLKKENIEEFISALHNQLTLEKSDKIKIKNWLENLITASQMIENNVNSGHVIDWLMLRL
jgi:DNA polymerase III delta prime subunit